MKTTFNYCLILLLFLISTVNTLAQRDGRTGRDDRYAEMNRNKEIKNEVNEKYSHIKMNLMNVMAFLAPSSADEFEDFKKSLIYFSDQNITLNDIRKMLNDPAEIEKIKDVGQIFNREKVEKELIPGLEGALNKDASSDYSLSFIDEYLTKVSEWANTAKQGGQYANENAQKVAECYNTLLMFQAFCNDHVSISDYVKMAESLHGSVKSELSTKYEKYRAGDFHRNEGSGIYFVHKNGVTRQTIKSSDVTEKIIIDGKTPVHIFVLTDMNLGSYGSFLQLDIVDEGSGRHQNKYVFDDNKMIPLNEIDEKVGYKKLILVPSENWEDMDENFDVSQFYSCFIQEKLANSLTPGIQKKLTFYAANGQIKKTVSVEITPEGVAFLKGMKSKMEKFEIDAARMEKPAVNNRDLENKISSLFQNQNSNVQMMERIVITSVPWYVEKDEWGNITHRHCYAQVAFKGTDGHFYIQKIHCTQKFDNGSYQALKVNSRFDPRKIRESNITE